MTDYIFKEFEENFIKKCEDQRIYKFVDDGSEKKIYILDMFPYPSGAGLHVGHLKGYIATDILSRYFVMNGYLVFRPIGWDAFGLPTEQHSISTGKHPKEITKKNVDAFRNQLKRLSLFYDFDREVNTSDPAYYKYTQKIFSSMYVDGLVELKDTVVNWCEELNTVLADEEIVEVNGRFCSERGNYPVVCKFMKQWVIRITDYADALLEDLKDLDWSENIKKIQEDWIGKDVKYIFPLKLGKDTYHLNLKYASSIRRLKAVGIHQFSKLSKSLGIDDFNFGNRELLNIKLKNLFTDDDVDVCYMRNVDFRSEDLIPIFESAEDDFYDPEIEEYYVRKYKLKKICVYKLKDWVFSRQRYWGEPIPILFDENGNHFLDSHLPVLLPDEVDYSLKRRGQSPLVNNRNWLNVNREGKEYVRETNTMPNWAGSSWYFIAFLLKKDDGSYYDFESDEAKEILKRWLPVDIYVGGQEHATMHLLYARFWHKFLWKKGIVGVSEPFKRLFNQGMVLGEDGQKMSKSKGNYVSIDEMIEKYGSDALRVYEAFSGPTNLSFKWEESGIRAMQKWLHKVHIFFQCLNEYEQVEEDDLEVSQIENNLVSNVTSAIPIFKVNLGVSEMMIFLNNIKKLKKYHNKSLNSFVKILSLYAPALADYIWTSVLNNSESLFKSPWPSLNFIEGNSKEEFKIFLDGRFKFVCRFSEKETDDAMIEFVRNKFNLMNLQVNVFRNRKVIMSRSRK